MVMYTIVTVNIWQDKEKILCWELQNIPKQLALSIDPLSIYEVTFSQDSTITYLNHVVQADKCFLTKPHTIDEFLTKHELWVKTLRESGDIIQYYRGEKPENLCKEAVKQNGLSLAYIEGPYQTEEICLYAVHNNWQSLTFVKDQTERICLTAIDLDGKAIQYVREPTPLLCSLAIQKGGGLEFLRTMSLDVCRMAVQRNGLFMKYIPVEKQTEEISELAIENNPYSLEWIENPSEKLCIEAVKKNGRVLQHVPNQTPKICMAALQNTGLALQYVKEYMLPKICSYALDNNIESIDFIPRKSEEDIWRTGFIYGIACSMGVTILLKLLHAANKN